MFDEDWAQEGTRPFARWHSDRKLCGFSLRGPVQEFLQVALPRDTGLYRWITQAPPAVEEPVAFRPLEKTSRLPHCPFTGRSRMKMMRTFRTLCAAQELAGVTCSCMGCEASPKRRHFVTDVPVFL